MSQLIEHSGTVVRSDKGTVEILIEQTSACASCSARMACATSEMQQKTITATPVDNLAVGDNVIVYGEQSIGIKAVTLAIVLPLAIILTALFALSNIIKNEGIAAICAIAVMVPYYIILALNRKKIAKQLRFSARAANHTTNAENS